jgi:hypothetical protein
MISKKIIYGVIFCTHLFLQLFFYGACVKKKHEIYILKKEIILIDHRIEEEAKELAYIQSIEYVKEYAKKQLGMIPLHLNYVKRIDLDDFAIRTE